MRCPKCQNEDTRVVDSRATGEGYVIRRRRECQDAECNHRFTTHERHERTLLWVTKKDGRREPYDEEKVLRGISLACRKRPITHAHIEETLLHVEAALEAQRQDTEVPTWAVGEAVMDALRELDAVAHVRFASVYREFESVEQFIEIVRPLRERNP